MKGLLGLHTSSNNKKKKKQTEAGALPILFTFMMSMNLYDFHRTQKKGVYNNPQAALFHKMKAYCDIQYAFIYNTLQSNMW